MRRTILIMLLLWTFASLLLAEKTQLEEITLDKFIMDYLPDYKISKQIQLDGIGRDFAVAKESGDIVAVTVTGDLIKVYFFDTMGNLQWEKEFSGKGYETNCSISDNGTVIVVTKYISDQSENIVFDKNGNILFQKRLDDIELIPTPNGKYFYEKIGMMASRDYGVNIYNRSGNEIDLSGYNFNGKEDIRIKFINDNMIISFMRNTLALLNFVDGKIRKIWQYNLEGYHPFDDFFFNSTKYSDEYIIVASHTPEGKSYIFDYNGTIIHIGEFYQSIDFISSSEIISGVGYAKGSYLTDLKIKNLQSTTKKCPYGPNSFNSILDLEKILLFHFTHFIDFGKHVNVIVNRNTFTPKKIIRAQIEKISNNYYIYSTQRNSAKISIVGRE